MDPRCCDQADGLSHQHDSPVLRTLMERRTGKAGVSARGDHARFDEASNMSGQALSERCARRLWNGAIEDPCQIAGRARGEGWPSHYSRGTATTPRHCPDLRKTWAFSAAIRTGAEIATLFNELTGAVKSPGYKKTACCSDNMFRRFTKLFRREFSTKRRAPLRHSRQMNQLQDRALSATLSHRQAGVRSSQCCGLCCLRAGVPACPRASASLVRSAASWNTAHLSFENGAIPNSS